MTPTPASSKKGSYLQGLDGLRAFAVLMVMFGHGMTFPAGSLGVDVFFVLSGFLITHLLLREYEGAGKLSLKDFYMRRVLRILPPLMALLAFDGVLRLCFSMPDVLPWWKATLIILLECANFFRGELGSLSHTWSLSVEEQFYMLWPLVLIWLLRSRYRGLWIHLILPSLVIGMANLLRAWLMHIDTYWEKVYGLDIYAFTPARIDGLLIGAVAALVFLPETSDVANRFVRRLSAYRVPEILSVVMVVFILAASPTLLYVGRYGIFSVSVAVLILCITRETTPGILVKLLELPVLRWIGKRSYGIYLYHVPIFGILERYHFDPLVKLSFAFGLSFLIAELSFRYLETPLLRKKEAFRPKESIQQPAMHSLRIR
jgi:peptidoglycan/LPS O-acetylase OafA/YrhL